MERAIVEAVNEMNVFIRGIARRRLKELNLPTDEIRISLEDGTITVARTGQRLVMKIAIDADKLPSTIRFSTTYACR